MRKGLLRMDIDQKKFYMRSFVRFERTSPGRILTLRNKVQIRTIFEYFDNNNNTSDLEKRIREVCEMHEEHEILLVRKAVELTRNFLKTFPRKRRTILLTKLEEVIRINYIYDIDITRTMNKEFLNVIKKVAEEFCNNNLTGEECKVMISRLLLVSKEGWVEGESEEEKKKMYIFLLFGYLIKINLGLLEF